MLIWPLCPRWSYSVKASVHWTSGAFEHCNVKNEPAFVKFCKYLELAFDLMI